jgi:hypothetical protein
MNLKKDEFRTLKQGDRTLKENMDDFCSLSRYAPEDIDTDAKRKDKFLHGLKGELKIPLSVAYAPNYQALLDQAITLDNNIRKEENRKRKFNNRKNRTEHSHKRPHSSGGNRNGNHNGSNGNHTRGNGQHRIKKDLSHIICYNCKKPGHYADMCSEKKQDDATTAL